MYVSGTLRTCGTTMELVEGGVACGASLGDPVKAQVYLANMADFPAMNEAYVSVIGDDRPARITVGRAELALGGAVELKAVAYVEPVRDAQPAAPARVIGAREARSSSRYPESRPAGQGPECILDAR